MSTERFRNPDYLKKTQYKDGSRLSARIRLHELYSVSPILWVDWIFGFVEASGARKTLELGCGTGNLWPGKEAFAQKSRTITLSDFSLGTLSEARKKIIDKSHFLFTNINAEEIPFVGDCQDLVIANHMLYHLPNLEQGIKEIARVLKPDGRLICSTNGLKHMREITHWSQEAIDPHKKKYNFQNSWEQGISSFCVENGREILENYFDRVDYYPYEDKLEVSDPQAIVDFMASSSLHLINREEENDLFDYLVERQLKKGKLDVRKDSGVFIAQSPLP